MADHAHDMGLVAVRIEGVAHGFTVDSQRGVVLAISLIPALKRAVQMSWVDPNHDITNDRFARHQVVPVDPTAAQSLSGFGTEALRPVRYRLVTAHATQDGPGGDRQHGGQGVAASLGAAWIGNVGEEVRQRSHLLGAQHNLGYSLTIGKSKQGLREHGAGIALQRFDEDFFGRVNRVAVALAGAGIAAGKSQIQPVGRTIDGAVETWVDEGLQKQQPMAKALLPIASQPAVAQGENLRAQIRTMPIGQNHKPAIVSDQFEPVIIILMVKIPTDPPIPHCAFPRGCRKTQQRHPLLVIGGHVPQSVTDLGQISQVMMRRHQLAMKRLFAAFNGTDLHFVELQNRLFHLPMMTIGYTRLRERCPEVADTSLINLMFLDRTNSP